MDPPHSSPGKLPRDLQDRCKIASSNTPTTSPSSSNEPESSSAPILRSRITKSASPKMTGTRVDERPSPARTPDDRVTFFIGGDYENEASPSPTAKTTRKSSVAATPSSNRSRFKKMLRPLRRSHSAGCSKDVPAHALFLRHEMASRSSTAVSWRFDLIFIVSFSCSLFIG